VRFLLTHPGFRSCDDCEKYIYDPKTGELQDSPPGSGRPLARPKGIITPCYCCAKVAHCDEKTPEVGRRQELSEKNLRTLDLYYAIHGARLSGDSLDDIAVENLTTIQRLMTHEGNPPRRL
jgi:hypothetical protein